MKIKNKLLTLLLGAVGLAVGLTPGQSGATTITSGIGYITLGFRADGSNTAYLVNLGNSTVFTGAVANSVTTLSLGNLGVDLQNTFGNGGNWYDRADLYWGVFGTSNSGNPNLYASKARTDVNTPGTPWPNLSGSLTDRQNTANQISNVTASFNGQTATANSNVAWVQSGVSGAASYAVQVGTPSVTDFCSTSQWTSIEGSFASGTSGTVLDLSLIHI